jgi:ABC-type glycerol-3-phosphate transport system permease component
MSGRRIGGIAILYFALFAMSAVMFFPFLYVIGASFKQSATLLSYPPTILPQDPNLDNYVEILTNLPVARWYLNSTIIAVFITVGEMLLCALTGYTFAKRSFPGKNLLFALTMATLMIPGGLTLIPAYLVSRSLGLLDTYAGVILPGLPSAFGVFMLRQFMQTIPDELHQAAQIDGCSDFGVFWRIILPISTPGMAVLGILAMNWSWNQLLWPLVILRSKDMIVLTVGLSDMVTEWTVHYGQLSAAVVLATAPLILGFLFFQRYFVVGLTSGAIKG